jgi:hypothetical protein
MRSLIERLEEATFKPEQEVPYFWEAVSNVIERFNDNLQKSHGEMDEYIYHDRIWKTKEVQDLQKDLQKALKRGGGQNGWNKIFNKWYTAWDGGDSATQEAAEDEAWKKFIQPMMKWAKKHKKQYGKHQKHTGA